MYYYEKTKTETRIIVPCESISGSIDIYIGFRKSKKEKKNIINSCINFLRALFVSFDAVCFENVLPSMMKCIKFNCSFNLYLLLTIRHNV